jgi:hypothetical protein
VNRQTEVFDDRNSNMNWQTEILFVRNTQKYVDWFWMKQRERVRDTQPEISFEWNRDTDKLRFRLNETEKQTNCFVWMKRRDKQTDWYCFVCARWTFLSAVRVKCVGRKTFVFSFEPLAQQTTATKIMWKWKIKIIETF